MGNSPYIVYIVADQFRGDCLGVEQSRHPVMTPHLDQIGWEGARFTRAYADCPICMPQRATMLTGQSASRFGVTTNFMGVTDRTPIEPPPGHAQCENLIIPVCLSASHIALGSVRMEPVFMVLAESAALAVCLADKTQSALQDLSYTELKESLLDAGQILETDVKNADRINPE